MIVYNWSHVKYFCSILESTETPTSFASGSWLTSCMTLCFSPRSAQKSNPSYVLLSRLTTSLKALTAVLISKPSSTKCFASPRLLLRFATFSALWWSVVSICVPAPRSLSRTDNYILTRMSSVPTPSHLIQIGSWRTRSWARVRATGRLGAAPRTALNASLLAEKCSRLWLWCWIGLIWSWRPRAGARVKEERGRRFRESKMENRA